MISRTINNKIITANYLLYLISLNLNFFRLTLLVTKTPSLFELLDLEFHFVDLAFVTIILNKKIQSWQYWMKKFFLKSTTLNSSSRYLIRQLIMEGRQFTKQQFGFTIAIFHRDNVLLIKIRMTNSIYAIHLLHLFGKNFVHRCKPRCELRYYVIRRC